MCFAQRQSPREVQLSCPLEHLTRDSFHDVAQFDLSNARDPHCFFTILRFTTILRLVFADDTPGSVVLSPVPMPNGSPVCIPPPASAAGLFAPCRPLPLAVDDADFKSNLLLGFGSGSIGLSLKSRAAGAAGSGSDIAAAVLSLLFFHLSAPPQPMPH